MQVTFLHPTTSHSFLADCEPDCTGEMAIEGLIGASFLEKPRRGSYDLVLSRTEAPILPTTTFRAVGVKEADQIHVFRRGSGA